MTACRRSAPASTYRLVNVSVNPSARFGACETEPWPSAASRPVDDALIWGSPLTAVTALECRFRTPSLGRTLQRQVPLTISSIADCFVANLLRYHPRHGRG